MDLPALAPLHHVLPRIPFNFVERPRTLSGNLCPGAWYDRDRLYLLSHFTKKLWEIWGYAAHIYWKAYTCHTGSA